MTKARLIQDSKEEFSLSKSDMILAVQAEKERRAEKGYSFNCFVVSAVDKFKGSPGTAVEANIMNFE